MRRGGQGKVRGKNREYARANERRRANIQQKTKCRECFARDGQEEKGRGTERDGRGETERRIEKYNVTEVGRRRDEQGATKKRKGAEFLKGLHLRAGFGIMEW